MRACFPAVVVAVVVVGSGWKLNLLLYCLNLAYRVGGRRQSCQDVPYLLQVYIELQQQQREQQQQQQ